MIRRTVAVAGASLALAMAGGAAASASTQATHGHVAVTSQVTAPPSQVSLTINTPGISFNGPAGSTVKQEVNWTVNSTDPNGFTVKVQTGSNIFTNGRSTFVVGAYGWQLENTDAAATSDNPISPNMSTTPLTVYTGTGPTQAGGFNGTDFYKATIPADAPSGTYIIPGGLQYEAIGN